MYDEILVPTDGSPAGERAVDQALELARTFGARIHALYVVDVALYSSLEAGGDIVLEALEREGESAVAAVAERAEAAGVAVEPVVRSGSVHRTITGYVDEQGIDLVVMGTHGRQGIERFLLGSVAERVVRTTPVPVMTVRATEEETEEVDATD